MPVSPCAAARHKERIVRLNTVQLRRKMERLVRESYADREFRRRDLMQLTEKELRRSGDWEPADDALIDTRRTRGFVWMDWGISAMRHEGRIQPGGRRGSWRLASNY